MMNAIAAAVVLYHTEESSFFDNIASYLPFVSQLFVVDNSPGFNRNISDRLVSLGEKIIYLANDKNRGIAAALNTAAARALGRNYSWLLTMDQDSFFEQHELENYFSIVRSTFFDRTDIAMIAPVYGTDDLERSSTSYTEVLSVITSGSLLNLHAWQQLEGFDEKLFIDEVDHEFCYRAVAAGFRIISCNQVHLTHNLGRKVTRGYLGRFYRRSRMVHNPVRVYYMVRNYLYVRKRYKEKFPEEFEKRDNQMRVILKNNLFFSGNFFPNFKNMIKGYMDYKRNNFNAEI